jgi:hypothetical protein
MPPAVAIAAAYIGTSIAAAIGLTGLAAAIVGGVIAMGINSVASSLFGFNEPPQNQTMTDISLNTTGSVNAIPVIYGDRRVGGTRVFIDTTNSNKDLHLVFALCEGSIKGFSKFYLNNELAAQWNGTAWVPESKYSGYLRVEHRQGGDNPSYYSELASAVGSKWTSNHKLCGVASAYVRLNFNRDLFSGLPTCSFDVSGMTVTQTAVGWVSADYNNPAWVLYDYLTNTRYGKGIDPAMIDIDSFFDTRDYCNELVNMKDKDGNTIQQKRYTADGHIDTAKPLIDNVKDILTSMNAFMIQSGGKYKVRCNKAETVTDFEFNEDNITGQWEIQLGTKTNRFNQMKTTYFEPDNNYFANIFLIKDSAYLADDNDQVYERELSLPLTCNYNRAAYISRIIMNQSRYQMTVTFNAVQTAMTVEVGDVVTIRHFVPGWGYDGVAAKQFRVMNITLQPAGDVRVVAVEYNASVYTNETVIQAPDFARASTYTGQGSASTPDGTVTSPSGGSLITLTSTSGGSVDAKQLNWTRSTSGNVAYYEITLPGTRGTATAYGVQYTDTSAASGSESYYVRAVSTTGHRSGPITITG